MAQPTADDERWERLIEVAAEFGVKHPDAVLVGGTVTALYAGHRVSLDADFVLTDLRERFEELVVALEQDPDWTTARLNAPVLILGRFKGVETGLRQLRRSRPLETTELFVRGHKLRVPTLPEILRIKGWLAVTRNATRDYLDLAALSVAAGVPVAAKALAELDECYRDVYRPEAQRDVSIALQLARQLAQPPPYDLDETDLSSYKRLDKRWQDWGAVREQLRKLSVTLIDALL
ncbi:MAG TPA: hypothetical protein VFA81_03225 [Burkholderiales bacterium]|nr:hypothetical protein [Burkholderiales bacterium]